MKDKIEVQTTPLQNLKDILFLEDSSVQKQLKRSDFDKNQNLASEAADNFQGVSRYEIQKIIREVSSRHQKWIDRKEVITLAFRLVPSLVDQKCGNLEYVISFCR